MMGVLLLCVVVSSSLGASVSSETLKLLNLNLKKTSRASQTKMFYRVPHAFSWRKRKINDADTSQIIHFECGFRLTTRAVSLYILILIQRREFEFASRWSPFDKEKRCDGD